MPSSTDKWSAFDPTKPEVDGVTTLMFALKDATDTLAVDANRTFLAGRGSDALGAALTTASTFPHVFAGVVARGEAPAVNAQTFRSIASCSRSMAPVLAWGRRPVSSRTSCAMAAT